jgi:hypothetical protein
MKNKKNKKNKKQKQTKKAAKRTAKKDFVANKFYNLNLGNGLVLRLEVFFVNDIMIYSEEAIKKLDKALQHEVYKAIDKAFNSYNHDLTVKTL